MKTQSIIKSLLALAIVAVIGLGAARAADPAANDQAALEAKAKVSKADAVKTALAKVPGTIEDSSITQTKDGLVWSFKITPTGGKGVSVVNVDATTGKIASVTAKTKGKKDDDDENEKDDD